MSNLQELVITVPSLFAGVDSIGFSARYREGERPTDVPLFIEGDAPLLARLQPHLELLGRGTLPVGHSSGPYTWTPPISLHDHLLIMSWRDRSLEDCELEDSPAASRDYVRNLVDPVAFAFLRDCVRFGHLRLRDVIQMSVKAPLGVAEVELRLSDITRENGELTLYDVSD